MHAASHDVVVTCESPDRVCDSPHGEALRLGAQRAAFDFVEATPDAVCLTGLQGMRKTLFRHGTRRANFLCACFAVVTFVLGLDSDRGKESFGERALAPRLALPSKGRTALFFFAA